MAVAVRLVEVLTLITLLGMLTGISIVIVILQRVIVITLYLLGPITATVGGILYASEKILVGALMSILNLTTALSTST
ncbi:uncharacterized protein LOC126762976 [Bactrocera neohumeralis]|uniref:Uncharacterized protein LOC125778840 n=1 Tax=Bactrocera dorsalis TaxID=27457 RepID=A0ABM3JYB2_BACDO|nr:uncharacterized protein LOC106615485 [Bactrocera oleae]XP_039964862.1 uncharacterized protein LOC120777540 [Bactrocera tryoni]XP_049314217.1 uncharacterized protein LOC125778840 [Bactrocera dorsalis]XP_050336043.1 uncharacterized protein LOC126762976 [Bactrocera neohumeralis]